MEALEIGGANQTTVTTAIAMKRRGHTVFVAAKDGPLRERLATADIPHFAVDTQVAHPSRRVAKVLGNILDRERVEVACPNGWDCTADMLLATSSRGTPVVPTFPAIYPEFHHPRVAKAIVFSGEYREALIRDFGWRAESLEMLIGRIDSDRFRPDLEGSELRQKWGVEASTPLLLMACRLDPMKIEGIRFLLDAVPSLARRCPEARVVLVGDGPLSSDVAACVDQLNASLGRPLVFLAGRVLEMQKAFNAADIVIGNGARSAMEGLACGRPVISVGPAGLAGVMTPENIEEFAHYNFDKGRVFDGSSRKNPEALAEVVGELVSDPALRARLGAFGREFTLKRLSVDAGAARLESLLLAQRPLTRRERIRQRGELARGVLSYLWWAGRRKARRMLFGSPGNSRAVANQHQPAPSFARNSVTTFLSGVFALGVGVLQVGVTARILRPEGKGELTAVLLLPQLFVILAPLGIDWASLFHLGRRTFPRETLVRTVLTALLILGGAGMLACLGISYLLHDQLLRGVSNAAALLAMGTIPVSMAQLFLSGLFRGEMRIIEANLIDVCRSALRFLLIVTALLLLGWGVLGVILAQLVAECLVLVLAFRRFGQVRPVPQFRWDVLRPLLTYGLKVYSFSILLYLNYRVDLFLVRDRLDLYQTGLYSSAVALAEVLWMVPNSLGNVLFPSVARAAGGDGDSLTLAICRSSFWVMLMLCGGLALGRNLALQVFFGDRFLGAGPALLALLPGILAMSVQFILGTALSGRGRPLPVTLGAAVGFVANILLNLAWIPRYGIVGASLASSVSYSLVTLVVLVAYLRISESRLRDAVLLKKEDLKRFVGMFGRLKEAIA